MCKNGKSYGLAFCQRRASTREKNHWVDRSSAGGPLGAGLRSAEWRRHVRENPRAALEASPALVNVTLSGRWPALHQAAKAQDPKAVRMLLGFGADPLAKNRDGKTPRELATDAAANMQFDDNRMFPRRPGFAMPDSPTSLPTPRRFSSFDEALRLRLVSML